jgi:hypothetical protein
MDAGQQRADLADFGDLSEWLDPDWLEAVRPPDGRIDDPPDGLDSLVMESRDRLANLALFGAAAVVWILVGLVVTTRDPRVDTGAGFLGAVLIGLALGLTTMPLFWLSVFARHRRIAYRGDWIRAVRRGAWVAIVVTVLVVLRLQNLFEPAIALFIVTIVLVAEATLSVER